MYRHRHRHGDRYRHRQREVQRQVACRRCTHDAQSDIIRWKRRSRMHEQAACARVCTCVHASWWMRGPRAATVRILYGELQARMGDQCFIDIAADAALIRLESAVAHI